MTDESFFDANGEVRPDGVNNLVPDLAIQKPRRHITLNAAGMNTLLARRQKRAEAEGNKAIA